MTLILALADAERTRRLRAALLPEQRLVAFSTSVALLRSLDESQPPLGIVLAALPESDEGRELLRTLERSLPGCPRLLWSSGEPLDAVAAVVEHGGVARLLDESASDEDLGRGLGALKNISARRNLERLELERLDFAHEVLRDTVVNLERHIDSVRQDASDVERLVTALRSATSLHALARVAAASVAERLPGRGVHVALEQAARADSYEAWAGVASGEVLLRVPLRGLERDLGVLEITRGSAQRATLSAIEETYVHASEAPIALATQGMVHRNERNDAQLATAYGLAKLAEHRDDTTGRHLERVSTYSRMLGEYMRAAGLYRDVLTDRYLVDLELAAPLHDIGKVAVPDAILLKPGKLDAEEWEIMRGHAALGAQTLETILSSTGEQSYLRMGQEIAWCHHERWDGGGYPRGLRDVEIPLSARIMALADVYDALTSPRPYKEAWTHERAKGYISDLAGRQFDPDVVRVFLERESELDAKRAELADGAQTSVAA